MSPHRLTPTLLLLAVGCGTTETATWLEGASYRWDLFNHRVSHLHFAATEAGASVAVVGGTSTTGLSTELDPSCDSDTCSEFPFYDEAHVAVDLVSLTTAGRERVGTGSTELLVGAAGTSGEITVDFGTRAPADAVAVLRGYTLNTDQPLSGGESCYQPRNGWLPRRIAIDLGEVSVAEDGLSATVPVEASFEAGMTFESERQCLDAVVDQAQVLLGVEVLVIAGAEAEAVAIEQQAAYPYGEGSEPMEQPDPDPTERTYDLGEVDALGWSSVDFRFHLAEGEQGRGAYIRTLTLLATPEGFVTGHANNYSPPTQLSGFDYAFTGTVQALRLRGEVERTRVEELVEIELDESGAPVAVTL